MCYDCDDARKPIPRVTVPAITEPEFQPWPKIARLNRDIVITEKLDGTNAAIGITENEVYAQSRTRILDADTKGGDNFGFAAWVRLHEEDLIDTLGIGLHFGEWWGSGIQRGYGLDHKRFSLFNVRRFKPALHRPDLGYKGLAFGDDTILDVVPVLYEGPFHADAVSEALNSLKYGGSYAAPGFKNPEGIVVFHTASSTMYKVTLEGDEAPKSTIQRGQA